MLGLFNPFFVCRVAICRRNEVEEDAAYTVGRRWVGGGVSIQSERAVVEYVFKSVGAINMIASTTYTFSV